MSNDLIDNLQKASLFQLWRLRDVIDKMLDDPNKLMHIKSQLRVGQNTIYFDSDDNKDIKCTIVRIGRTRVLVQRHDSCKRWNIPFYMLNINNIPTEIKTNKKKIDRLTLKIGDLVGFVNHRTNQELYGKVTKLNPKTALVKITTCEQWRVSYPCLFYVLDGETGTENDLLSEQKLLEAEAYE